MWAYDALSVLKAKAKQTMYNVAETVIKDLPHFKAEIEELINEVGQSDELGYYWIAVDALYEYYDR